MKLTLINKRLKALFYIAAFSMIFSGCSEKELALTADNCRTEVVVQIKNKEKRQEFAGLCARTRFVDGKPVAPDLELDPNSKKWRFSDGVKK